MKLNHVLAGMSPEEFLKTYWQKKPLLIRQAFPDFKSPITKDDMFSMAMLDDIASRLVIEEPGEHNWQVRQGPFTKKDFKSLPDSHWTILVQEVNAHHEATAELLDHFSFIPNWRVDDIMVSYAADKGGVGPHTDNYDVFLLQGSGKRRWRINHTPVEEEHLVEDLDIRILDDFTTDEEWILEPGDMLYLPPKIAHYGIAEGECMTISIGFRTPSHRELLIGVPTFLLEYIPENQFYTDPDLTVNENAGEISLQAIERVQSDFLQMMNDREIFERWLGRFVTEPKRGFYVQNEMGELTADDLKKMLGSGKNLIRKGATKISYLHSVSGSILVYANGEEFEYEDEMLELIQTISNQRVTDGKTLLTLIISDEHSNFLLDLIDLGAVEVK